MYQEMDVCIDPENKETRALFDLVDFSNRRVLEIGCGDGRLTWRYAHSAGKVTGIDSALDDLRAAVIDCPSNLVEKTVFTIADAVKLPFRNDAFDIALLAWSL
jgi:ubiquinone/menaquinone biosynthesis C-methylase UbiE